MIVKRSPSGLDVSVVIPAHNEAGNLPKLVEEIAQALDSAGKWYEIVVVDDASTDDTASVLTKLSHKYSSLVHHRMARQSGQSSALSAGFDLAAGDVVITIDADLQNDPADIPNLLANLAQADVAIGWRRDRKDTFSKRIISKVANRVRNYVTGECVKDTGCGLKAFKAESLRRIHRFDGMHRFFPTLVKMHGYSVVEVPVNHRPRKHGRTHYNLFNRSIRPMMDLMAVRWLQKRTLRYELAKETALVRK
ncbi:glycosyltransferase family 2 protein [bacterium]|jgi:dolichol-phosphate mannosyltransferase|nr:glycosyltransferase family 2 protein [bacterium]